MTGNPSDIAPWPETPREYVDGVLGEIRSGRYRLRRKQGSELSTNFRVARARVAGMHLYVAISWPADE